MVSSKIGMVLQSNMQVKYYGSSCMCMAQTLMLACRRWYSLVPQMLHGLGRHLLRHSGVGTAIVNAADDPEEDEQERKGSCMRVHIRAGNYFLEILPLFAFL